MAIINLIKRFILIIFLALTTFSFNGASCAEVSYLNEPTISAPVSIEKLLLNNKENELFLSAAAQNETTISSRRNDNQNTGFGENAYLVYSNKNNNINSYFSKNSYLESKTELALLLLKHQIHPNAP